MPRRERACEAFKNRGMPEGASSASMAKMLEKAQSLGLNVPHYHATLKTMKAEVAA